MAYMQNKQMPIRNYGALRNMMLAQNTAPNPYRSPEWMGQIAQQKALENQAIPPASNRPIWRHPDGTPATPAEIYDMFGKDLEQNPNVPIGERGIDFNAIRNNPNRQQQLMDELDKMDQQYQNDYLERQNQSLRYPTPAEQDAIRRSGNPFTPSQRDSIWNEMKNWR